MVGGQILIVFVGGSAFQVVRIGGRDWGISIVIGAISLVIGFLIKFIPTPQVEKVFIRIGMIRDPTKLSEVEPAEEEEQQWNAGIAKVMDNLGTFNKIRGGRLRSSSIVRKSRTAQLKEHDIHPSSLMAMVSATSSAYTHSRFG